MARKRLPMKTSTSFRLTEDAQTLLDALVDKLGISKGSVVEQAIRRMARSEKVRLPGKEGAGPVKADDEGEESEED